MRPVDLLTRIYLDGGDPSQTRAILNTLGFLDGQTTNPSLVAANPTARKRVADGKRFGQAELLSLYKDIVQEIAELIPKGSVSIEVYADAGTTASEMMAQAQAMNSWINNAHIKFPITAAGLAAAHQAIAEGMSVNMTLCFTQAQAAAVHAATLDASQTSMADRVYVSPFVGRLDDKGLNGMELIANILAMYGRPQGTMPGQGGSHVKVLAASIRKLEHMQEAFRLGTDIITVPYQLLVEWAGSGTPMPGMIYTYSDAALLQPLPYQEIALTSPWEAYDINHPQTDSGLSKFAADWNALLA